jgi:hypothetical protein
MDGLALAVEDIGPVTGDRFIGVQGVPGVVGIGDQVNGRGLGDQLDVGLFLNDFHQVGDDGLPRPVADMEDPSPGMGPFLSPIGFAVSLLVEGDPRLLDQDLS